MTRPSNLFVLFLVALFCGSLVSANVQNENLQRAQSLRFSSPTQSIELIKSSLQHDLSDDDYFEYQFLHIMLLLKVGKTQAAHDVLSAAQLKLKDSTQFKPWLDLIQAYLHHASFQNSESNALMRRLEKSASQQSSARFNMWFDFVQGTIIARKNDFDTAILKLESVLSLAQKNDFTELALLSQAQLVNIYYYMQQFDKALASNEQLIAWATELGDKYTEVAALSNSMNIYYMMQLVEQRKEQAAESDEEKEKSRLLKIKYMQRADELTKETLEKARATNAFRIEMRALILYQNQFLRNSEYDKAIEMGNRVVDIGTKHGVIYETAVAYNNIAITQRAAGNHEAGLEALKKAEKLYKEIGNEQFLLWVLEDYSIAYQLNKDFEKAFDYYQRFHEESLKLLKKPTVKKFWSYKKLSTHKRKVLKY